MPRKRDDDYIDLPPHDIFRGETESAIYKKQIVPEFIGNPCIEALTPVLTPGEVIESLSDYPVYKKEYRQLDDADRIHMLDNAREFFIPQALHIEIHYSISNMLRRGYVQRNPIKRGASNEHKERAKAFKSGGSQRRAYQSKPRGLSIIGPGGMGKTTVVEHDLLLYPQVIDHGEYGGQDLILRQLVWLKLQCPSGGSLKALCIDFFRAIDDVLGTHYYDRYSIRSRTAEELPYYMALVASFHYIGVIVIDEIEDLNEVASGGAARVINFLVKMENIIGVPLILIGTPDALPILGGRFRHARRVSEQGLVLWPPMAEFAEKTEEHSEERINPVWEEFLRALWQYQYIRNPCPLQDDLTKDPLHRAIYDESKGITAVACALYVFAQRYAILTGTERLTPGLIRTVAKRNQGIIKPMLDQLKLAPINARLKSPRNVPDLNFPYKAESQQESTKGDAAPPAVNTQDGDRRPGIEQSESTSKTEKGDSAATTSKGKANPKSNGTGSRPKNRRGGKARKSAPIYEEGDLRNISAQLAAGTALDDALTQINSIPPANNNSKGR